LKRGELSIEEALKKGTLHLKYIPLGIIALGIISSYFLDKYLQENKAILIAVTIILSIVVSSIYWAKKVVSWRLEVFPKVSDYELLERKAISRQLIYSRGSILNKLEWPSQEQRLELEQMYIRLEETPSPAIDIDDRSLPAETVYRYQRYMLYIMAILFVGGIYLLKEDPRYGIFMNSAALIFGFLEIRKIRKGAKQISVDAKGIALNSRHYLWKDIESYHIKPTYLGSKNYELILQTEAERIKFELDGYVDYPLKFEDLLDAYYSRFLKKKSSFE